MGQNQSLSGPRVGIDDSAAHLLVCMQQQKLEDKRIQVKQLEKKSDGLRKQSPLYKGLAAFSLYELHQQQLSSMSSAASIKKLSSACAQLSIYSACVKRRYNEILQELAECQQQQGEFEERKELHIAKVEAELAAKAGELSALQATKKEVEERLRKQEHEACQFNAQLAASGNEVATLCAAQVAFERKAAAQDQELATAKDQATIKAQEAADLQAAMVSVEEQNKRQAQEIATLKAQLEAKAQEAEGHQAAKVEAEQKYLKQVEAHQVALQTQSEVRAALAKSLELNQTLLFDQKAGKEALAALQEKAKSLEQVLVEQKTDKEALRKEIDVERAQNDQSAKQIKQCLLTIDGLNKIVYGRKAPNQEVEQQPDIIRVLGIMVQHQEDQKTEAAQYILNDLEPEVKKLKMKLNNALDIVWDQQAELMQKDAQLWEQHRQLEEKDRQLQLAGRSGYRAFIAAVDRQGRVSRALRGCSLDSEAVLNTPAAALCIAAGLPNISASSLKRVYLGLSLGCHPDHSGEVEAQKKLNQVWVDLEKAFSA